MFDFIVAKPQTEIATQLNSILVGIQSKKHTPLMHRKVCGKYHM